MDGALGISLILRSCSQVSEARPVAPALGTSNEQSETWRWDAGLLQQIRAGTTCGRILIPAFTGQTLAGIRGDELSCQELFELFQGKRPAEEITLESVTAESHEA